jgi:hypothetical protein
MAPSESPDFKDENGKPLEIKEGIVIDQNGNPLTEEPRARTRHQAFRDPFTGQRAFVFKTSNPLAPLLLAPLLIVLVGVGLTLFTGVAVVAFAAWMIFLFFRTLRRL